MLSAHSRKFYTEEVRDHPYADFLSPIFKNAPALEQSPQLKSARLKTIETKMRENLINWLVDGMKENIFMTPKCEESDFRYAYQDFKDNPALNTFSHKENIAKIARQICLKAVESRNTLESLNFIAVRDAEIRRVVEKMIK